MILHIPNVLSKEQLIECRKLLDNAQWIDGKLTAGSQAVNVKSNLQLAENSETLRYLRTIIINSLNTNPLFISSAIPNHIISPFVNRYENGGAYGNHVDNSILYDATVKKNFRTDISCSLFFTNPEEYEGGEMVIEDTFGTHEVKLPAGDMILYPSTSLHRVEPVTKGVRMVSFMWIQSMIRSAWKRSMLFELDNTIQTIRGKYGETQEAVNLSIHYHKLIQEWAEL
ncbi:Fe2+-dependent dioxygenase [Arcobacter cloacae]|uniref:Fe2+-dependent dioxygenase n=1 Tax=Arcobacter cloacae TaxID=1054034 RepID=A0A6M8NLF8_9BACT|nr:Fe2+-dependent dioxygenase [Arcobacter cloacae]QKF89362.1 2OG-Fe(II) oxygenase family protein [Arcobacter cloacae]RXI38320.1 Fe2+-dependent dioxygenase [Arcobacter cloacae]